MIDDMDDLAGRPEKRRLPAEWEPQSAVLLTWPHGDSDWGALLEPVCDFYCELAGRLLDFVAVLVAAAPDQCAPIRAALAEHPRVERLRVYPVESDDCWARDHGPIGVEVGDRLQLLDFVFNGWGNKFEAAADNRLSRSLQRQGAFGDTPLQSLELVLEGGSIEADGEGGLLLTEACLLNPNRNPGLSRAQLEQYLQAQLGVDRFHWLAHGYLSGDDTDSHIDTLARLCPNNVLLYMCCDDPSDEHYAELQLMQAELRRLRNRRGQAYDLRPLPWPDACFSRVAGSEAKRLPASYANFLITNGAVLVPTYGVPQDRQALVLLQSVFSDRRVVAIDCRLLLEQHGSLHCITMQLPAAAG